MLTMPTMPHMINLEKLGKGEWGTENGEGDRKPDALSRSQRAPHDRGDVLATPRAREHAAQSLEPADRHGLETIDREGACGDEPLETRDGHLIETAFDFTEPCGAIRFEIRAPTDERPLREEQMRP